MGAPVYLVEITAQAWPKYLRSGAAHANGSSYVGNTRPACTDTLKYRINGRARRSTTADGTLYIGVVFYDSAGAEISTQWYAASGATPTTSFADYWTDFGFGTAHAIPGGTVSVAPRFVLNSGSSAGLMFMQRCFVEMYTGTVWVTISNDWQMRNPNEWSRVLGTAGSYRTLPDTTPDVLTLRYSSGAYCTQTGDTPPRTPYDPRVQQPGSLSLALPAGYAGGITASYGEIVLNNADGRLNELAYHGVDGQPFRVLYGQNDAAYSTFAVLMAGSMQQVTVDRSVARVRLAGRDLLLERPICPSRYLGNNSLPNGLEGTASDLKDQPKPALFGLVRNISPPCVNTSRLIYQVSVYSINAVDNVCDAGVELTRGTTYTSQADMEANAPAGGTFREWPGGGYFRLGSAPTGLITCDASGSENTSTNAATFFNVLYEMAFYAGLDTVADVESGVATGYTPPAPPNFPGTWMADAPFVGFWTRDGAMTTRQAMERIAQSVGAWFGWVHLAGSPGNTLRYYAEVFPPADDGLTPAYDLSSIKSISGIADPGPSRGLPVASLELTHWPNYTVFTPEMAPSIPPDQLYGLAQRSLRVRQDDAVIAAKHVTVRTQVVDTLMGADATLAGYELQRRFEVTRYPRPWYDLTLSLQAVLAQTYRPRLGNYVQLSWPEMAVLWQDGVTRDYGRFNVMGIGIDFARNEMRLTVRQAVEQRL